MWMHYMDAYQAFREKDRWEQYKNATWYIELILEATFHETIVVRPPTSYL